MTTSQYGFRQLCRGILSWNTCRRMCSQSEMPKVGFIGLGNMGYPMAVNLSKAGCQLLVHDRNEEAVQRLQKEHNVVTANSPSEVAASQGLHVVITMLPSPQAVLDVYLGHKGFFSDPSGVSTPLFIDSSTIDPGTARKVESAATLVKLHEGKDTIKGGTGEAARHPFVVDAPVSGGVPAAQGATLTFMVGGDEGAAKVATRYLNMMGKRVVYCGPAGRGQAAKLCNNLVLGIQMAAVAEGLSLGQKLGLDPALLSQVFNTSSARCWSSEVYNPCPGVMSGVPSSRDYRQGFAVPLMLKDLGLAAAAGEQCGAPLPLAATATQLYRKVADSDSMADFSAVYKYVYRGLPA